MALSHQRNPRFSRITHAIGSGWERQARRSFTGWRPPDHQWPAPTEQPRASSAACLHSCIAGTGDACLVSYFKTCEVILGHGREGAWTPARRRALPSQEAAAGAWHAPPPPHATVAESEFQNKLSFRLSRCGKSAKSNSILLRTRQTFKANACI
jgi:hypothetical protein